MELVSIVTAAYKSHDFITRSVESVLKQSYQNWEMIIISDDQSDYQATLEKNAIKDKRIKFVSTGKIASGESNARNTGITNASSNIIAILDSDDAFKPTKLELVLPKVLEFGMVSTALDITSVDNTYLRSLGNEGTNRVLQSTKYKKTNCSMDSMIIFDQKKFPVRYDTTLKCLPDLDLVLKIFEYTDISYHFATPLHLYYKQPNSISNSPGAHKIYTQTKNLLLQRLADKHYNFADPNLVTSITDFLNKSLKVEKIFEEELKLNNQVLFEDVFEKSHINT